MTTRSSVCVAKHDRASVTQQFHDRRDLAALREAGALDDVERLVEDQELAFLEVGGVDVRMHVDAHVLAVDDDLDRPVLVGPHEHAVGVRRRTELVDLFLEEFDLLLGLLQRRDELLVLALGIRLLLATQVVAAAQGLVFGQHTIQASAELSGVTAEEAHRLAQVFDLVVECSSHCVFALGSSLAFRFVARRDPPHDVADESASPRI